MNDFYLKLLENFNTREIATGMCLILLFLIVLVKQATRTSLFNLLRAALKRNLLFMLATFVAYVAALCWVLSKFNLWSSDQIIPTFLWLTLSGIVLLGRSLSVKKGDGYFSKLVWDSVKIAVLFEFVVVANTFSLIIELLFVPLMALLGIMIGIGSTRKEYLPVKRLFEFIATIVVSFLLWHSITQIWHTPNQFLTTQTGRNLILPTLLTIGSIPIFYLWYCYANIELAIISLNRKEIYSYTLRQYAKRRFIRTFFLKPWLLKRATRQFHLLAAHNNDDVDSIINEIKLHEKLAKNPPTINERFGWSPFIACNFLTHFKLRTDDYHICHEPDEWCANSNSIKLSDQQSLNTATFYIEGKRDIVTTLKLKSHFYNGLDANKDIEEFEAITAFLIENALGVTADEAAEIIPDQEQFDIAYGNTNIIKVIEKYSATNWTNCKFIISKT